jgi:hypothetical protein
MISRAPFPLTPTLSLRERGHHRQRVQKPRTSEHLEARGMVLSLPEGEGWGEGKGTVHYHSDAGANPQWRACFK